MLKTRRRYPSLGYGQRPQLLVRGLRPPAYCILCGHGVSRYVLQRPMCVHCWRSDYELLPIRDYRDVSMPFCHRCGKRASVSFGDPQCSAHDEEDSRIAE